MSKRKVSDVWKWFGKSSNKKLAKCNTCGKEYKTSGNTSNLLDHVKRSHGELLINKVFTEDETSDAGASTSSLATSSSRSISDYFSRQNSYEDDSKRKNSLDKALVIMIATDFQPFQIVEDKGFRRFVKLLDPRYNLPSKGTLRNKLLVDWYNYAKLSLKNLLAKVDFVSITCDMWTSAANDSYLTATCHFFDDFVYRNATLATTRLTVNHTAENLSSALYDILTDFDIKNKVACVVTDNAPNIVKACQIYPLNVRQLPCIAHTLNLVVQDAFKCDTFSTVLKKCKEIVAYVKHSNLAEENLRKQQREMGRPELKLKQEVPTRWNSALYMLQRLLEVHDPLTVALSRTSRAPAALTADEILIIKEAVSLLKPFEEATTKLSGDTYVSVSLIIPVIVDLQIKLSDVQVHTSATKELQTILTNGVVNRLHSYEERTYCRLATLLDPRLKKEAFRSPENARVAVALLQNELTIYISPRAEVESTTAESESGGQCTTDASTSSEGVPFQFMVKRLEQKQRTKTVDSIILLRQYLERTNTCGDPLLYWKVSTCCNN